jgi:hydrogenase-4 component E
MGDTALGVNLIVGLSFAHLIASMATAELRNLRLAIATLILQSALLSAILSAVAYVYHNPAIYWWALFTFLTKVILIPALLFWHLRQMPAEELRPVVGVRASVILVIITTVVFYRLTQTYIEFVAPTPAATQDPARTCLAIAFTIFALGIYALASRRDAIKAIIGLHLLENGAHLSLATLAPTVPATALLGIPSNVVLAAYLVLYLTSGIYRQLGIRDTAALSRLRG